MGSVERMTSNKGRPPGPDNQDDYETAVLDFLEKEMTAVQPEEKRDPQSAELDALVSDLLKQVITETEQPQSLNELVYDKEDELFSGLTPNMTKASDPVTRNPDPTVHPPASLPAVTPAKPAGPDNAVIGQKAQLKSQTAPSILKPPLASESPSKGNKPLIMAAAFVCIAVILGVAGYFFFGSQGKTPAIPKSQPAAAQAIKPQTKAVSEPVQSAANASVVPEAPTKPTPVPAAPISKQPDNSQHPSIQQSGKPSPSKEKPEATPAKAASAPAPAKEEKPAVTTPQVQEPAPVPVPAAVEKPAAAPVPDSSAAVLEKKPVPPLPAPPASAAPPPAEPRSLVAAVPISQATPAYPELALRTRASGSVVLELQVDEQGKVTKATPVGGQNIFYNAAVTAAMKWRYRPASIGGVNVRSVSKVTMDFNLKK